MKRNALIVIALLGLAAAGYFAYRPLLAAFSGGGHGAVSCEYNGNSYKIGDQRRADDGCNVCTCRADGWSCTQIYCPAGGGASGTITGTIGSPGGKIPAERICAVNLKDDREYCQQSVEGETTYAVPAPAGDYWVYATLIQTDATQRAYYSAYETCGEKPECKDHSPIKVTVAAEQIAKADPKDWSAGGQIDGLSATPSKWEYGIHNYYPGSELILKSHTLSRVEMFYTAWPPQNTPVEISMGQAALSGTDHGIQTWKLAIPTGFEATTVFGVGTAQDGDFMRSRELQFVRPIDADASSTVQ